MRVKARVVARLWRRRVVNRHLVRHGVEIQAELAQVAIGW